MTWEQIGMLAVFAAGLFGGGWIERWIPWTNKLKK